MKIMNRFRYLTLLGVFFLFSCGSSSSGTVEITLDVSALSTGDQDSIANFVFIVSDVSEGSGTTVFYPSECLSSDADDDTCLVSDCGFPRTQSIFDPGLGFDDFPEGSTVSVVSCALNSSDANVGAGTGQVQNQDGQTQTINLDAANPCTGLPPVCS